MSAFGAVRMIIVALHAVMSRALLALVMRATWQATIAFTLILTYLLIVVTSHTRWRRVAASGGTIAAKRLITLDGNLDDTDAPPIDDAHGNTTIKELLPARTGYVLDMHACMQVLESRVGLCLVRPAVDRVRRLVEWNCRYVLE